MFLLVIPYLEVRFSLNLPLDFYTLVLINIGYGAL